MKPYEITVLQEAERCLLCYDAPCTKVCPAKSDPAAFIKAIRLENRRGGARQALENNPLGSMCAMLCTADRYCEKVCIRGKIDRPVDISMLHTYIAHQACTWGEYPKPLREPSGLTVAVLGADIAALAAATALALDGVQVSIFASGFLWSADVLKQLSEKGGDRDVLNDGMNTLVELGIHLLSVEDARAQIKANVLEQFDAVVVASKEAAEEFGVNPEQPGVFLSGDLVEGPNDAAFSVRKGRMAAGRARAYAEEKA